VKVVACLKTALRTSRRLPLHRRSSAKTYISRDFRIGLRPRTVGYVSWRHRAFGFGSHLSENIRPGPGMRSLRSPASDRVLLRPGQRKTITHLLQALVGREITYNELAERRQEPATTPARKTYGGQIEHFKCTFFRNATCRADTHRIRHGASSTELSSDCPLRLGVLVARFSAPHHPRCTNSFRSPRQCASRQRVRRRHSHKRSP